MTTTYPAWAEQPNTPVTYPAHYAACAAARGLAVSAMLAEAGLTAEQLAVPGHRVSLGAFLRFLTALLATGQADDLGLAVGLQLPLTAHGHLGYALLCAETPRDALDTLQRYWVLRGRGLRLSWTAGPDRLVFRFQSELVLPPALARIMQEAMVASFWQGLQFLLGGTPLTGEMAFNFPAPPYLSRYQDRLPTCRHDALETCLVVADAHWLDHRLATGNPEGRAQALALCARELALWGDLAAREPLLLRAQAEMELTGHGYPRPHELADRLHLSLRTLRRRLAAEGTGYHALRDAARARDALILLSQADLEIQHIAQQLGYDDPANFTRAFRRRTGLTPSAWRLAHRQGLTDARS